MRRAALFTSLLWLGASLSAVAGGDQIGGAVRATVEKKVADQSKPNESDNSISSAIADRVANETSTPSIPHADRDRHYTDHRDDARYYRTDDSWTVADCPFGKLGTPTFDSLRYKYRDLTDAELWKICLNRNTTTIDGNVGACACALLASPDPWRPVDVPHNLERNEEAPPEHPELRR
ncbi:MAG TPA: hypothetical protein VFS58_16890 [Steroidobacteraceae bacterium]|nr:hypothetical protein [Steroidobacteraceae bacterium]